MEQGIASEPFPSTGKEPAPQSKGWIGVPSTDLSSAAIGSVALRNWLWDNAVTMSKATETAAKMLESLPEPVRERVVEELRTLVEDARDEAKWDDLVAMKKDGLVAAARKARKDIARGKATDMDFDKL